MKPIASKTPKFIIRIPHVVPLITVFCDEAFVNAVYSRLSIELQYVDSKIMFRIMSSYRAPRVLNLDDTCTYLADILDLSSFHKVIKAAVELQIERVDNKDMWGEKGSYGYRKIATITKTLNTFIRDMYDIAWDKE